MIEELIFTWIKIYPLVSILIFILYVVSATNENKKNPKDPIKVFREIESILEKMKDVNPKFFDTVYYVIEEAMSGNKVPVYLFILFFCFVPVIRLSLFKTSIFY